jgi:hypothetical protein
MWDRPPDWDCAIAIASGNSSEAAGLIEGLTDSGCEGWIVF